MAENSRGIVSLAPEDKNALYAAYIPMINNGGLFIQTNNAYQLGDEVVIFVTLMGDKERVPVAGQVVWITPPGAQGNRVPGIGVQFSDPDQNDTHNKIESLLAGSLGTDRLTHTM